MNELYCNNCGKKGHLYNQCKLPITSLGIIAFRFNQDKLDLIKMKKGLYLIKIKEDKLGFDLLDELIKKNSNLKKIIEAIITD